MVGIKLQGSLDHTISRFMQTQRQVAESQEDSQKCVWLLRAGSTDGLVIRNIVRTYLPENLKYNLLVQLSRPARVYVVDIVVYFREFAILIKYNRPLAAYCKPFERATFRVTIFKMKNYLNNCSWYARNRWDTWKYPSKWIYEANELNANGLNRHSPR